MVEHGRVERSHNGKHRAGGHLIALTRSVEVYNGPGHTVIGACAQTAPSSLPACADSMSRLFTATYGHFTRAALGGQPSLSPITASSGVTRVRFGHRAATAVHLSDGDRNGQMDSSGSDRRDGGLVREDGVAGGGAGVGGPALVGRRDGQDRRPRPLVDDCG